MSKTKNPKRAHPAVSPPLSSPPPESFPPHYDRLVHALHTAAVHPEQLPPTPEHPHILQTGESLTDTARLNQQMQTATWAAAAALGKALKGRLFLLTPENAARLRAASPSQSFLIAELENLSGLLRPSLYQEEPVNIYLTLLGSLPAGNPPDWKEWFITQARQQLRIPHRRRPPQYEPTPLEAQLEQLTAAIAAEPARTQFPMWPDLARSLLRQPWQLSPWTPPIGQASPQANLPLSAVLVLANHLRRAAGAMGCPPETYAHLTDDPLETAAAVITAAGIPIAVDCGQISALTPPELKARVGRLTGQEALQTNARYDLWSSSPHRQLYELIRDDDYLSVVHISQFPEPEQVDPAEPRLAEFSRAELALLKITAPADPWRQDSFAPPRLRTPWGPFARHAQTTPAALADYIAGEATDWQPDPSLAPCPEAGRCPTRCAQLQRDNSIAFPLTQDGSPDSCQWREFLNQYGDRPPEIRQSAARLLLEQTLQEDRAAARAKLANRSADDDDSDATANTPEAKKHGGNGQAKGSAETTANSRRQQTILL